MTLSLQLISAVLSAAAASADATPNPSSAVSPQDAPPPEYPQWSGALAAGMIITGGNSDSVSGNASFNAQRRAEKDRWTFDAFWNWSQQGADTTEQPPLPANQVEDNDDTEVTTLNGGAGIKYDYFATKKLYYYANATGKSDPVADLDLRYILGAGVGYQWREDEKVKWGTELGLSYVDEDYLGTVDDTSSVAVRVASNLGWVISERTSFEQVAEAYPNLEDSEDFIAKVDNRLKMIITGKWIAQLQYVLDFDDSTPSGIEEADHRFIMGIGWSFGEAQS